MGLLACQETPAAIEQVVVVVLHGRNKDALSFHSQTETTFCSP